MFAQQVRHFLRVGVHESTPFASQFFGRPDDGFRHPFVGLLGASDELEAFAFGDALLLVGGVKA